MARRIVLEVPQQGSDIRPDAAGLEAVPDGLDVADGVGCGVEEEDGRDGVVGVFVGCVFVEGEEVGGAHGHFSWLGSCCGIFFLSFGWQASSL